MNAEFGFLFTAGDVANLTCQFDLTIEQAMFHLTPGENEALFYGRPSHQFSDSITVAPHALAPLSRPNSRPARGAHIVSDSEFRINTKIWRTLLQKAMRNGAR